MGEKKVVMSTVKSLKTRIIALVAVVAIMAGIFSTTSMLNGIKQQLLDVNESYLFDMSSSYGTMLDSYVKAYGTDLLDDASSIEKVVGGITIRNMDSCYVYVVSLDGTMLYHPTAEKIGKPVENSAVKQLVSEIEDGDMPEPQVIRYEYNGEDKFAATYTADTGFILVVTADEDEILESSSYSSLLVRSAWVCGILTVVDVIFAFIIANSMTKSLKRLMVSVKRMGELDFTEDDSLNKLAKAGDETGEIARAVQSMRAEVANAIVNIREQSKKLYDASAELDRHTAETSSNVSNVEGAVSEIAMGASSQASETQQATEDIVTMGSMIQDTNDQVANLSSTATLMRDSSKIAAEALHELDEINGRAIESIDVIYEQTNATNESAKKIKEATALISSIASETNLLSLNASIEAARAGEAGRGFAVVASQIQNLSEQSDKSAKNIDKVIAMLMKDSETAVATMENVKKIMKQQNDNVVKTEEVFSKVREGIDESLEGMDMIVTKVSSLDEAKTGITTTVQNLTAIAQENAANTEETTASVSQISGIIQEIAGNAAELQNIAKTLETDMKKFRV